MAQYPCNRKLARWIRRSCITDHIEYRPNKEILKGDLNESYKIAKKAGDAMGLW